MYREIKELLKLAAVHAPLYGFLKLFCTFLSALFVPANALLLQRILDGLVSFSCSGRLPADWYRDLVWMAGLLLGEGLLTGTDGLLAVRFEMQVTDRLETRLMEKLRNLEYSRMEEPQIQDLLSGISQNPSREICSAFWKLSEGLRTAGTLAGMLAIYLWKASGLVPLFVLCMTQMLRKNGRAGELWFALYEKQTRSQRRGRYYGRLGVENFSGGSLCSKTVGAEKPGNPTGAERDAASDAGGASGEKLLVSALAVFFGGCSCGGILPGNIIGRYFCHAAAVRAADGTDGHRAF